MSEIDPKTVEPTAPGTGGENPTATPTAPAVNPTVTEEKTITLKEEDYKNLISARDRANNISSDSEGYVATLAKREGIEDFLSEHKTDYPLVVRDDLMNVEDPEALEAEAKRIQRRYEDVVKEKLLNVEKAGDPVLSPEDKAARLEELKKKPGSSAFGSFLNLQRNR